MSEGYGQSVKSSSVIRSILRSYPLSAAFFREIIQNSDDAGAQKQVFLLDRCRSALFAYNDGCLAEHDWHHLHTIYDSSKTTDTSKIGQMGQGFRTCYHITDTPEVLSGFEFEILDGSERIDLRDHVPPELFAAYHHFLSVGELPFRGTLFRYPLRTTITEKSITDKPISANDIRQLLDAFIREELNIILLFLQHVQEIQVIEVSEGDSRVCLARAFSSSEAAVAVTNVYSTYICRAVIERPDGTRTVPWRVIQSSFPSSLIHEHLGDAFSNLEVILKRFKKEPKVGIAIPLGTHSIEDGRLFNFLPLPIRTGFPFHIHGWFSVLQSRQDLVTSNETGVPQDSAHSFHVHWNIFMLSILIPRSICALLTILVHNKGLTDVFSLIPASSSYPSASGIPQAIIREMVSSRSHVWPALNENPGIAKFLPIDQILIVDQSIQLTHCQDLAKAGLAICCVPSHIMAVLKETEGVTFLSPSTASAELKVKNCLHLLNTEEKKSLLSYLVSTGDVSCAADLPLVPLLNGSYVQLVLRSSGPERLHTLVGGNERELFELFDLLAIDRRDLPSRLASDGPALLNIEHFSASQMVAYLSMDPNPLGFNILQDKIDGHVISWLSRFWVWYKAWNLAEDALIQNLYLIPSDLGLRTVQQGAFRLQGVHPSITRPLQSVGVPFLSPLLSEAVQNAICRVRSVYSLEDLCDFFGEEMELLSSKASWDTIAVLFPHFLHLARSLLNPLNSQCRDSLRRLPIVPVLTVNELHITKIALNLANAEDHHIYIVADPPPIDFLPLVPNSMYIVDIGGNSSALHSFLHLFGRQPRGELRHANDILLLAMEHFPAQPHAIQVKAIAFMADHVNSVSADILNMLRCSSFIRPNNSSFTIRSPLQLVDPASEIACLFPAEDNDYAVLPREHLLVNNLRRLQLLQATITPAIASNRIRWLASASDTASFSVMDVAKNVLRLLSSRNVDLTAIEVPVHAKWLPTEHGLMASSECRDTPRELFDQVWGVVALDTPLAPGFRELLSWDRMIPLPILLDQLDRLAERKEYQSILLVLIELSRREMSDEDYDNLRQRMSSRYWIPTIDSAQGILASPSRSLFYNPVYADLPWFKFVAVPSEEYKYFLGRIADMTRPSTESLLSALRDQHEYEGMPSLRVKDTITILKSLPAKLSPEDKAKVLVPDTMGILRPIENTYFKDPGSSVAPGYFTAHPQISRGLADQLGMKSYGVSKLQNLSSTRALGEDIVVRIRRLLQDQYTDQQILSEFLANAVDAGANRFGILIDEGGSSHPVATPRSALSAVMEAFLACPALVIHNNATFRDVDWEGICNIGIGGKASRQDTIGQFGLGSLVMFHLTELPMIVSGDLVMFLDPTGQYLPPEWRDRRHCLCNLNDLFQAYPSHLESLDGLFGFSMGHVPYQGTLFRLPLRQSSQLLPTATFLLNSVHDVMTLRKTIVEPFCQRAHEVLLFTNIVDMHVSHRRSTNNTEEICHASCTKAAQHQESTTAFHDLTMHVRDGSGTADSQWTVAIEDWKPSSTDHGQRLRLKSQLSIGVAIQIHSSEKVHRALPLFARLPIPGQEKLPIAISAPFILAPDRRNIRFDARTDRDTYSFNQHLLTEDIPALILKLFGEVVSRRKAFPRAIWLEGRQARNVEHDPCGALTLSLYSKHLPTSKIPLLRSGCNREQFVAPHEAVITKKDVLPLTVQALLRSLSATEWVILPSSIPFDLVRDNGMTPLTPAWFKDYLLRNQGNDPSLLFRQIQWTFHKFHEIIRYLLSGDEGPHILEGLHLLPISDGSWTTFRKAGPNAVTFHAPHDSVCSLFRPQDTVHLGYLTEPILDQVIRSGLNVERLTAATAVSLLRKRVPEERMHSSSQHTQWVTEFWDNFHALPDNLDISSLPVVPVRVEQYVSLNVCKSENAIVLDHSELPWDISCLDNFGAIIVVRNTLPTACRQRLIPGKSLLLDVLESLQRLNSSSYGQLFERLQGQRDNFCDWICSQSANLAYSNLGQLTAYRQVLVALPIWRQYHPGRSLLVYERVAAQSLTSTSMLHRTISRMTMHPFAAGPFVEHHSVLEKLGVQPMQTVYTVLSALNIPRQMANPLTLQSYKRLIMAINKLDCNGMIVISIPNRLGEFRPSNKLFRSEQLFTDCLPPSDIIHEVFQDLESDLASNHGLHSWRIMSGSSPSAAMHTFCHCATVVANSNAVDKPQKCATLFNVYCEELSVRVASEGSYIWSQVANIRFIPRDPVRRRGLPDSVDIAGVVRVLPEIVSPNEILLNGQRDSISNVQDVQAVAWTQRALFLEVPGPRIFTANPSLGQPFLNEVLEHLRALKRLLMRTTWRRGIDFLLSDLNDTYQWLNARASSDRLMLRNIKDEELFLNATLDGPVTAYDIQSRWCKARNILYCEDLIESETETQLADSTLVYVSARLHAFKSLLLAAGAINYSPPEAPAAASTPTDELSAIRQRLFCRMRQEGKRFDAVIFPVDGEGLEVHRLVLASACEHLYDMFTGDFQESQGNKAIVKLDVSAKCLRLVVDFIYTAEIPQQPTRDALDVFLEALSLAESWDFRTFFDSLQAATIKLIWFNTHEDILNCAERVRAATLKQSVQEWQQNNREALADERWCQHSGEQPRSSEATA